MRENDIVDILLVEDNTYDAELIIRVFKQNNMANNLYLVEDGAEALDFLRCQGKFKKRSPSCSLKLMLLDLKLPKISGLEVLKEIKNDDRLHKLPVVILTSSREDPDISEAYRRGANSYVIKPVNFDEFVKTMSELGFYWLLVNNSPAF